MERDVMRWLAVCLSSLGRAAERTEATVTEVGLCTVVCEIRAKCPRGRGNGGEEEEEEEDERPREVEACSGQACFTGCRERLRVLP